MSRSILFPRCQSPLCVAPVAILVFAAFPLIRGQGPAPAPDTDSKRSEAEGTPASQPRSNTQELIISPDDLLDIYVFDVPELSRSYRVDPSGSLRLPLIPMAISAAGATPAQLSQAIADKLRTAGLVSNPQVTVAVKESRLHSVAITGAVKKPQIYPIFGRTTLLDAMSQSEGLAEDAGNTAVITRGEIAMRMLASGGQEGTENLVLPSPTVTVDLRRLMETGDPSLNLDLYPGDRVTVQRAGIVYVVGAANKPGGFTLKDEREEMTVLKAIALAADLKPTALRSKAMIIRRNSETPLGYEEIHVDLRRVLAARAPDPRMQPSDILFVPDSSSQKALRRGAEVAIQLVSGIVVFRR